jgi:hypothetical protein
MTPPQFLVQLPEHLIEAYKAGEIMISGGVARDVATKQIVAHLEQAAPELLKVGIKWGVSFTPLSAALVATDVVESLFQGVVISKRLDEVSQRVNEIYNLVNQLQFIAWMNTGLLSLNLGLNLIGFCKISSQINKLSRKLDRISSQIDSLLSNEQRKLFKETQIYIKQAETLSGKLDRVGLTEGLGIKTLELLNHLEVHLQDLISRYQKGELIQLSLEYIYTSYLAYANLLRAYFTAQHLKGETFYQVTERIQALEKLKKELISQQILDLLYEECTWNQERMLTEREIKDILCFYKASCKESFERVNSHFEILSKNGLEQLDLWRKTARKASDPVILIYH